MEVLYKVLIKLKYTRKLIKIRQPEVSNRVPIGRCLLVACPVHNGLKQGDAQENIWT
jgi:hypothetical protein